MLSTAVAFFAGTLPEKLGKQLTSHFPILPVDAVFHFWRLDFPLYQPSILQLLEVLRNRRFRYRQLLVNIPEVAALLPGQKLENCYSRGMSHRFSEVRHLFLLYCILFVHHAPFSSSCSQTYEQYSTPPNISPKKLLPPPCFSKNVFITLT